MAAPTPPSSKEWLTQACRWPAVHPRLTLLLVVLAVWRRFWPNRSTLTIRFSSGRRGKFRRIRPIRMGSRSIGMERRVLRWWVTQNPPLASYYLALAAGVFGWSEVALHFAFLLPAVAAIFGTHRLARRFCQSPILAALATLFTPVFLVSSTTVMCDVMMLAFWVWAAAFWLEGLEENRSGKLFAAGGLIALAALTKYFGACLIPLLVAYSVIGKRRFRQWAAPLLIPLAALCAYQWVTRALYGHALLSEATDYAKFAKGFFGGARIAAGLTALTFAGGCLAVATFFAPLLWRMRVLALFACGMVLLAAAIFWGGSLLKKHGAIQTVSQMSVEFQIILWSIGGLGVLALALADVLCRRDARSWSLALWVLGTFLFAAFFNWTVNGRSLLPMAPAVGILLARRLEQNVLTGRKTCPRGAAIPSAAPHWRCW